MSEQLRPAGLNERRCIVRDTLGLYGKLITIATYRHLSSKEQSLSKETIWKALIQCFHEHPALQAVIRDAETEQPRLVRATVGQTKDFVEFLEASNSDTESTQQVLQRIHNEPFVKYEHNPQWKVYVVSPSPGAKTGDQHQDIAFACSHALMDGRSGVIFHQSFLKALREMEEKSDDTSLNCLFPSWDDPKLLPPLEQAADLPISWSFLLKPLLNEYLPSWPSRSLGIGNSTTGTSPDELPWTGATSRPQRPEPSKLIPTAVHHISIPKDTLKRVLTACHKHDSRLTALLNHLIAHSLSTALHNRNIRNNKNFIVDTSIDLRRCMPSHANSIASLPSTTGQTITVNQIEKGVDWPAIQQTTQQLSQASSTLSDQPVGLLKYLTNFRAWTLNNASKPATSSFEVSNVGTFDATHEEGWTITNVVFSQSANGVGPPLNFNVASAKGGGLNVVVTWWPGMLGVEDERDFVAEIGKDLVRRMEGISSS